MTEEIKAVAAAPTDRARFNEPRDGKEVAAKASPSILASESTTDVLKADHEYDFLWRTHEYTNEYIRFADSKGTIILGAAGALLSAELAKTHEAVRSWLSGSVSLLDWIAIVSMALLTISALIAGLAIAPRLSNSESNGLIYWRSIEGFGSAANYLKKVRSKDDASLNVSVGNHLFDISSIAARKFHLLARATWFGFVGGMMAIPVIALF